MNNYEKLGAFYLGRTYDLERREPRDELLLYDSKDLTTHALCVGMTGSGKTGLCVSLLEEAAIDGIPALVIDPKGDLSNLALTFPDLRGEDFRPWVQEDDARRKGQTADAYAAAQAELWRNGLAEWGQDGERIRRLRAATELAIYTPGSSAGIPISIVSSFAAPPEPVCADGDLFRERVGTTVTSLLGLMGIDADPVRSREHILLSNVLDHVWRRGDDLDLAGLIQAIQAPPIERVGVMDLDAFYPAKDRFELAMQLNNLLASPTFQGWLEGRPLDVQQLLYTAEGRPRTAVLSIAHLGDAERMFFVSMLLNQVLGWTRTRPGTTSLRAIVYMDEIFGYIPPTAEPPSKRPFLTLLKQARAFGVGLVLATQNPVDLDYKGLSNTGTWFLGRLQTERDKARVLDGLEGAAPGGFDRAAIDRTLSGLGKRVFLMHNVHEDAPVVFQTRWAMSYLRGPLTREQIKQLPAAQASAPAAAPANAGAAGFGAVAPGETTRSRPLLPPQVPQAFVPSRDASGAGTTYRPGLLGLARVQFVDGKTKSLVESEDVALLLPLEGRGDVDWQAAEPIDVCPEDLEPEPEIEAGYGKLPDDAANPRSYKSWKKEFADTLYRSRTCRQLKSPSLGLVATPGESEADFRIRLSDLARQKRDGMADKLRKRYATRLRRLEEKIRKAEQRVGREQEQARGQKAQTVISLGTTVLGALLGRKALSLGTLGRATTTARGVGRAAKEHQDIKRAEADLETAREQFVALNKELEDELETLEDMLDGVGEELETIALRPRRSDIDVRLVTLAWVPSRGADAP